MIAAMAGRAWRTPLGASVERVASRILPPLLNPVVLQFRSLRVGIEILGPFPELISDIRSNCGSEQVAASLRFRP